MELIKKQMYANRAGKKITDQFMVDDDYNVPDTKRDIARIVMGEGHISVDEIKKVENYLYVTGELVFQVLYVTDEEEPRLACLEGKRPFEEVMYTEDGNDKNFFISNSRVDFNAAMIHSRKISIKALIDMEVGSDQLVSEETTVDLESSVPCYKRKKDMQLLQMHTNKKDTYRIKEEMNIPGTKENIGNLLWTDISNRKLDTRISQGQIGLQGEMQVFCFYESQEGKLDWVEQTVPYEGRVDVSGVDESMYHHIKAGLNDVNVDVRMDSDGELRVLGIEGTLELRVAVYKEEPVEFLEDVYSLEQNCKIERKDAAYEELVLQNHSKCKVSEQLSLPEIKDDILQICHCSGSMQIENSEITENGILLEGILHICFLYVKENDQMPFDTWQGMVPFSYVIESGHVYPQMNYDVNSALEQLSVTLLGSDEIEVKAVLAFHCFLRKPVAIQVITDVAFEPVEMADLERRPGVVGYVVKENEDLWSLAKRYNTTVDSICDINEIEDEKNLIPGDKLLIFKENMSIL